MHSNGQSFVVLNTTQRVAFYATTLSDILSRATSVMQGNGFAISSQLLACYGIYPLIARFNSLDKLLASNPEFFI